MTEPDSPGRIFVGIPTFNRPELVRAAVLSVLAQTSPDFTAVVSDNCSDGDTPDRVERFVREVGDPRVTFHRQPVNGGEYGQGRFFLRAAQSAGCPFLVILHDDDVLLPDFLRAGTAALARAPEAAFYVANAYAMDETGRRSAAQTARHARDQGRVGAAPGLFDVLAAHLAHGFAPISGTLFRVAALERSGFVDPDCFGNYPFEANVFLRLGEHGAKAWFDPAERLGVRYHSGSLRNQRILHDPLLVSTSVRIWARRRFTGAAERRRRVILARFARAEALIRLRQGDHAGARESLAHALRANPRSTRAWAVAPWLLAAPAVLRLWLPPLHGAAVQPSRNSGHQIDATSEPTCAIGQE